MDLADLKPMREEGQRSFSRLLGSLRSLGVTNATMTTSSQLTKLQLLRLATEAGVTSAVRFT